MTDSPDSRLAVFAARRAQRIAFAVAFLFAVSFALYTGGAWEDWYTAFRVSKNLAAGAGPVYTAGERVQAFSSPLGMLVPALFALVTGGSDEAALWLYRLFGAGLLGVALVLLLQALQAARGPAMATWLLAGLFALDAKTVAFSVDGMETGLMMVFIAATLHALAVPGGRPWLRLGLAWAGLMWTRPDAVVYIGALAAGFLLFGATATRPRGALVGLFARAGAVCAVAYLPWFSWAWWYFGSPVPHTITAKGLLVPQFLGGPVSRLAAFPLRILAGGTSFDDVFMPAYHSLGGWPPWMGLAARALAVVAGFYWLVPRGRPVGRAASFASLAAHAYLSSIPLLVAPWYVPSVTILAAVALVEGARDLAERLGRTAGRAWAGRLVAVAAGALVAADLTATAAVAHQLRFQQRVIERGNREPLGRWLRAEAAPGDRVFLECPGYIGFYSQLKVLDHPGLASREVVDARRRLHRDDFGPIIAALRPEWIVLRLPEAHRVQESDPGLLQAAYAPARVFSVSAQVSAERWLPGRRWVENDETFVAYRRADPAPAPGQPSPRP